MSRYQTAMATLSSALEKARTPTDNRSAERHSRKFAEHRAGSASLPRTWEWSDASHARPPLLVRMWRAAAAWSARRDFNSHK
jgi:hypothetical protein